MTMIRHKYSDMLQVVLPHSYGDSWAPFMTPYNIAFFSVCFHLNLILLGVLLSIFLYFLFCHWLGFFFRLWTHWNVMWYVSAAGHDVSRSMACIHPQMCEMRRREITVVLLGFALGLQHRMCLCMFSWQLPVTQRDLNLSLLLMILSTVLAQTWFLFFFVCENNEMLYDLFRPPAMMFPDPWLAYIHNCAKCADVRSQWYC